MGEILLFAVTPPRLTTGPEQARQIAEVTLAATAYRWESMGSCSTTLMTRATAIPTHARSRSCRRWTRPSTCRDLAGLDVPAIVYRAVSKYAEDDLRAWLRDQAPARALSVFVGASSREKTVATSLLRPRTPDRGAVRSCCSAGSRSRSGTRAPARSTSVSSPNRLRAVPSSSPRSSMTSTLRRTSCPTIATSALPVT